MPANLVKDLVEWSDLQSMSRRTSEGEVIFRVAFTRQFMSVAVQFFKWFRTTNSSIRLIEKLDESSTGNLLRRADSTGLSTLAGGSSLVDGDDIITDAGNDEEEGDEEEGEDSMAMQN
jgi:hypothetical protein